MKAKVTVICLTTVTAGVVGFVGVRVYSAQNFTSYQPFTAHITTHQYNASGQLLVTKQSRVAVASDGSFVEERLKNGQVAIRIIRDRKTQTRTAIDFLTESTTTSKLPPQAERLPTCNVPPNAPGSTILGNEVRMISRNWNIPAGHKVTIRTEMWVAPALSCYPLQTIEYVGRNDSSETVNSVSTVTRLVRGEPDSTVFAAPDNHIERKPSEVYAEYYRRHPEESSSCGGAPSQDEAYERARVK
jgi:hypothetical protein